VNLADLQRAQRQDEAAEQTLRAGLHSVADNASLHYALGLTLVRQKRYSDAVSELALAARYAPEQVRYTFVYGVALHDAGRYGESLAVLGDALKRHPGNRQVLQALASYSAENGDKAAALSYAQQLRQIEGRDVR
jgi:predicted Zn-dependent protease